MLEAENNLVGKYFGDEEDGYSNLGGLSIYAPASIVSPSTDGKDNESPLFKLRQSKYSLDSWNNLLKEL